jgi:hypothetical protein
LREVHKSKDRWILLVAAFSFSVTMPMWLLYTCEIQLASVLCVARQPRWPTDGLSESKGPVDRAIRRAEMHGYHDKLKPQLEPSMQLGGRLSRSALCLVHD